MDVLKYPHPVLLQEADSVDGADPALQALAGAMFETMYASRGIGLAAPQVGVSRRLIVINVAAAKGEGEEIALANPEIVECGPDRVEDEEGCLSLPGITAAVPRWAAVTVEGLDLAGKPVRIEAEGMLARVLQHEIDHLDGILFVARLGPVERAAVKPKLREMKEKAS